MKNDYICAKNGTVCYSPTGPDTWPIATDWPSGPTKNYSNYILTHKYIFSTAQPRPNHTPANPLLNHNLNPLPLTQHTNSNS